MSYRLVQAVMAVDPDDCGGAIPKYVFAVLAHHADDAGQCWPATKRVADLTGLADRTVRRALDSLERHGRIRRQPRRVSGHQDTTLYTLLVTSQPVTESTSQPVTESTSQPVTESTSQPVTESTSQPVTESKAAGHRVHRIDQGRDLTHTRAHAREAVALVEAAGHPPLVERVLLAVAAQWPPLVAGGWVDVGESWRRTASEWTEERVERALSALARMERPPTPGALLAASKPPRGPARASRTLPDGAELFDGERVSEINGEIQRHTPGSGWGDLVGERARRARRARR